MAIEIQIKRVYEPADPQDGYRVLVDRLWPRGLTKEHLQADLWLKEAAPSNELRKWFHQDLQQWEEFRRRYILEIESRTEAITKLSEIARGSRLTLLYASRDEERNHALLLKEYLLSRLASNA